MATRPDSALREASKWIFYEFKMLRRAASFLLAEPTEGKGLARWSDKVSISEETVWTMHNAMVESFLVHARNLAVFFGWNDRTHPEDVLAKHYVKHWEPRGPSSDRLRELYSEVSTHAVHLSYGRADFDREVDRWFPKEIVKAFFDELDEFLKRVDAHLVIADLRALRGSYKPATFTFTLSNSVITGQATMTATDQIQHIVQLEKLRRS